MTQPEDLTRGNWMALHAAHRARSPKRPVAIGFHKWPMMHPARMHRNRTLMSKSVPNLAKLANVFTSQVRKEQHPTAVAVLKHLSPSDKSAVLLCRVCQAQAEPNKLGLRCCFFLHSPGISLTLAQPGDTDGQRLG